MIMFRLTAGFLVAAITATGAMAADQLAPFPYYPAPAAVPQLAPAPPPRAFDWGRCYAGMHVGTKTVDNRIDITGTPFYRAENISKTTDTLTGPIGGLQLGCNMILDHGFLIGFELEGAYGKKNQVDCSSQTDPVSYCVDLFKEREAFLSTRFGYVVDDSFLCGCTGGGLLVYGRIGAGYTKTDISMNVNAISYVSIPKTITDHNPDAHVPEWAQNYDLKGSKSFFSPLFGIGIERAITPQWSIRADFTTMFSMTSKSNLTVNKLRYLNPEFGPGAKLPKDPSGIEYNPSLGDKLPVQIREVETKLTFGVNRLF
jgi:opacity protein-like surface antigen